MIVGLPLLAFVARRLAAHRWISHRQSTFNLTGGFQVKPEFLSLYLALSFYTASFIAEIVRAGIVGVSKGQTEAAAALGLRPARPILRLVVVPQALRIIIPPLTSQYLNLTKNSSLAIADRLSRPRGDRRHDPQPDRPGDRDRRHLDGRLSRHQPA